MHRVLAQCVGLQKLRHPWEPLHLSSHHGRPSSKGMLGTHHHIAPQTQNLNASPNILHGRTFRGTHRQEDFLVRKRLSQQPEEDVIAHAVKVRPFRAHENSSSNVAHPMRATGKHRL
jgi:hypothetical protein